MSNDLQQKYKYSGQRKVSSTNGFGKLDVHMQKKKKKPWKLDPYHTQKSNEDLNVRTKTIKLLEESIGGNLNDIGFGNASLDIT